MQNQLCDLLGIDVPIVLAPMGGAVGPHLTAAVSNAGGLGLMPLWDDAPAIMRARIHEVRALTTRPFGVNLNLKDAQEERLAVCLEEGVGIVSLFWGDPAPLIRTAHDGGAMVLQTVGSAVEARRAVDAGADVIVAQGWEAGGHVWGKVATLALVPAVIDAVAPVPVIAAGGIADGRGLAAVLALGASAAWIGTRFLSSPEATIHARYRELLFAAGEADTYYGELFDIGWPAAPHRTLHGKTVEAWQAAGSPSPGSRPGEGDVIVTSPTQGDSVTYQSYTPPPDGTGDIDAASLWAGQGVALVRHEQAAGEIVREIINEARAVVGRLADALP